MARKARWALAVMLAAAAAAGLDAANRPSGRRSRRQPGRRKKVDPKDRKKDKDKPGPKNPGLSELLKLYEARQFTDLDGKKLPYRLLKPSRYSRSRRYPIVVCLHGFTGQGTDNTLQVVSTYPVGVLARPAMRKEYPCFVFAPQAPHWWGDKPYGGKRTGKVKQIPAMSMMLGCLEGIRSEFNIDRDRIYLTGHGMGAFGVFNALRTDPNTFAAALTVSGGGDPNGVWPFAHVPLWAFGGEKSPILHYTQSMVAALKRVGGTPKLTVIEGVGTRCWQQVYDVPAAWNWLFGQRRREPMQLTTQPATQPTQPAAVPKPPAKPG